MCRKYVFYDCFAIRSIKIRGAECPQSHDETVLKVAHVADSSIIIIMADEWDEKYFENVHGRFQK